MQIRIYYENTDAGGIVYHANYLNFCERARSEALIKAGINFSKNGHFVVSKAQMDFIKPAIFGDLIEVRTKAIEVKKASATLEQKIYKIKDINNNDFDELLFNAKITIAFVRDLKPAKMSDEVADFLKNMQIG